jgi:hypothetical protein
LGSKDEILHGVYPEAKDEILHFVQDDSRRRVQDDSRRKAQDDRLGYLTVEFSCFGVPSRGMGVNAKCKIKDVLM